MASLLQDVRLALRGFRRSPGFTAVTLLLLGLGIGANVALFSIADSLVLRPLPYPAPHELVAVPDGLMYPDFVDLRAQARSLRGLALYRARRLLLTASGEAAVVNAVDASAELFSVLGVRPVVGQDFGRDQDRPGQPRTAVLSHGFWQREFGADPAAIGRSITLEGQPATVVGVAPPEFRFPLDDDSPDVWLSLALSTREARQWRGYLAYRAIGRLAPNAHLAGARAEVQAIGAQLARTYPKDNAGRTISLTSYDTTVRSARPAFLVLLAAVALVLLIACANVANLQVVRATSRRREIAVRAALGAGRGRVVRQFLTEGVLLTLFAGVPAGLFAWWGTDLLLALMPEDLPRVRPVVLDSRLLLFALVAALSAVVVVGLVPALQLSRGNLLDHLRGGDRAATTLNPKLRSALLIAEIALAVILVACAGLLVRSFAHATRVDPGFDPHRLVVARLKISPGLAKPEFYMELQRRLESLPGVRAVTIARELPYGSAFNSWNFTLDDRAPPPPDQPWWANTRGVSHSYFDTLGIRVLRGRGFTRADVSDPVHVAVINETFARRFWPRGNPLGRRIRAYHNRDVEIVGIVADTRGTCSHAGCAGSGAARPERPPEPEIYLPLLNAGTNPGFIAVRSESASPPALGAALRTAASALTTNAVIDRVSTMERAIDGALDRRRLVMLLLAGFAGVALLLASLGVFGVVSYTVAQRTREIGIRMALGATANVVRTMVVLEGMRFCLFGLILGILLALASTRLLASQLYGVTPSDPLTYLFLIGVIAAIAVIASLIPALRASRVDPMVALRADA